MKFSAKYEISKTLAREEVEVFAVRKKASGEELVAYIFACTEAPQNQPTAQWILLNFVKMAPDAPGNVLEVGHYDVANFAYVVMSLPPPDVLDAWIRQYQNEGDSQPPTNSSEQEVAAAASEQPTETDAFVAEIARDSSSASCSAPPGEKDSSEPAIARDKSRDQTPVGGFGAQPRESGDFTRQFFREVVAHPDEASIGTGVNSAAAGKLGEELKPSDSAASSEAPPKAADTSPHFAMGFPQASGAGNSPTNDESAESQPGRISSGEFSRFFQVPSERREAATKEDDRSAVGPGTNAGEFTRIFGSEFPKTATPGSEEPTEHSPAPLHGSSTEILNNIPARASGPTSDSGGFTELFRPDVPAGADDSHRETPAFDGSSTGIRGSSTDLFSRDSGIHGSKPDIDYSFETKTPHHGIDGGSSTQLFGDSGKFSATSGAGEQFTNPGTSPSSAMPEFQNFDAGSGGATVVFRPASERPVETDSPSAGGPSPYSVFMSREELAGAMRSAEEASKPNASSAGAGAGAAAAPVSPFIAPPVVPSFQPPPMPVFPPAPVAPGGAMPGMPAMAPPAVAVPKPQVPPPSPKSYWPLIITLNVLLIVAVLLILYFVLKH
ncbi:MAG: hypothetical protein WAM71_13970 [Candidatus Korobacteraceae bacterium]